MIEQPKITELDTHGDELSEDALENVAGGTANQGSSSNPAGALKKQPRPSKDSAVG